MFFYLPLIVWAATTSFVPTAELPDLLKALDGTAVTRDTVLSESLHTSVLNILIFLFFA